MALWFGRFSGWLVRHKRQIGTIVIGHTMKKLESFLFDWLLYGTVIAYCATHFGYLAGMLYGFVIMATLSGIECYGLIRAYDWAGKDWLGFEALKQVNDCLENGGRIARFVFRVLRYGSVPAFIALSLYGDPFETTIYLRDGSGKYNGLSARDYRIFFASVAVSNLWWTLNWTAFAVLGLWLWHAALRPALSALGIL